MLVAILAYLVVNLALSLYVAYRRPSATWSDHPWFFVVLSAIGTIPALLYEFYREAWRR